jgi:hypothetical protein
MLAILILILAHKPNAANSIPINSPYCTYSFNNGNMIRGCSTVGFFVPVEVDGDDEVYDEVMRNAPVRLENSESLQHILALKTGSAILINSLRYLLPLIILITSKWC